MKLEDNIKEIENIASKLESPELGIDEGVKLYEEGISLIRDSLNELNNIKGKIICQGGYSCN